MQLYGTNVLVDEAEQRSDVAYVLWHSKISYRLDENVAGSDAHFGDFKPGKFYSVLGKLELLWVLPNTMMAACVHLLACLEECLHDV